MSFEEHLIETIRHLRSTLANSEVNTMRLDIEVTGRVHDGELLVTFRLGAEYGADQAKGDSLQSVTDEFLRRSSWGQRHNCLRIAAS